MGEKLHIKVSPRAKQVCIEGPRELVADAKANLQGRLEMLVCAHQARPASFARMLDTPTVGALLTRTLASQGLRLYWKVEKMANGKGESEKGATENSGVQDAQVDGSGAADAQIQIQFFSFVQTMLDKSLCMSSFHSFSLFSPRISYLKISKNYFYKIKNTPFVKKALPKESNKSI